NVFALHPKPPDRLVVLLIKRSDRVEHFKFPLFFNKFKDPTYETVIAALVLLQDTVSSNAREPAGRVNS
ncbi:MAG: hypothetical protein ACREX3_25715, partial [Gammaproteobacteria bacterium]